MVCFISVIYVSFSGFIICLCLGVALFYNTPTSFFFSEIQAPTPDFQNIGDKSFDYIYNF